MKMLSEPTQQWTTISLTMWQATRLVIFMQEVTELLCNKPPFNIHLSMYPCCRFGCVYNVYNIMYIFSPRLERTSLCPGNGHMIAPIFLMGCNCLAHQLLMKFIWRNNSTNTLMGMTSSLEIFSPLPFPLPASCLDLCDLRSFPQSRSIPQGSFS